MFDGDVLDDVVGAVADRADGETVAANAGAAGEPDVLQNINIIPNQAYM